MKGNIITYCISAQVSSHIKFTNSPKPNEQTRTITTHSISISNRFSKCKATEYERKKKVSMSSSEPLYFVRNVREFFLRFHCRRHIYIFCVFLFLLSFMFRVCRSISIPISSYVCWLPVRRAAVMFDCVSCVWSSTMRLAYVHNAGRPSGWCAIFI